jgi:nucleotide-binding universal stress UspA family protein
MYKKIMVPVDGSQLAECVLPHVQTVAAARGVQSVVFVQVADSISLEPPWRGGDTKFLGEKEIKELDARNKAYVESYLEKLVSGLDYGQVAIQKEVLKGMPVETLADYARKNGIDLIIMATHGRSGASRWVWGSMADRLLHSAEMPVLLVRPDSCPPPA